MRRSAVIQINTLCISNTSCIPHKDISLETLVQKHSLSVPLAFPHQISLARLRLLCTRLILFCTTLNFSARAKFLGTSVNFRSAFELFGTCSFFYHEYIFLFLNKNKLAARGL